MFIVDIEAFREILFSNKTNKAQLLREQAKKTGHRYVIYGLNYN
jgi:hypothetical protein